MTDLLKAGPEAWAEPVRYGVLHETRLEALRAQARELGWDVAVVDLDGCDIKKDLLERLATGLDFPIWFGGNWDALFDCLADMSWRPARGYLLVLKNAELLREVSPEVFDTMAAIFEDAAGARVRREVPFRVWIDVSAVTN